MKLNRINITKARTVTNSIIREMSNGPLNDLSNRLMRPVLDWTLIDAIKRRIKLK